jgi:N6-adenosine-specific RNA methylase IME4
VVSNERELKAAWDELTRGGTKVALTEGHAAKKIKEMVDMTIQGRGVRFIYREVSSSGGPAIDIMLKYLRGGFDRWRRIHISQ